MWLYAWLDEYEVKSADEAIALVSSDKAAEERLGELAYAEANGPLRVPVGAADTTVVAGRALDMSGLLACNHIDCMKRQVEDLFNEIWHYFDSIVVEGPSAEVFVEQGGHIDERFHDQVELLLWLRSVGAEPYLEYCYKPRALCAEHYKETVMSGGLTPLLDKRFRRSVIDAIVRQGKLEPLPRNMGYVFTHPGSDLTAFIETANALTLRDVAKQTFQNDVIALLGDISLATSLRMPLVQVADTYRRIRLEPRDEASVASVALDMQLPVVKRMPVRDLLRLREDHWPELHLFRNALRVAIREEMTKNPTGRDSEIAAAVVRDRVEPELAKIGQKLQVAKRTFERKTALSVLVSTVAASVSLLAGAPLVVGGGVAVVAGTVARHGMAYIDSEAAVEMGDFHFLWRARQASKRA